MESVELEDRTFFSYKGEVYDITERFDAFSPAGFAFAEIRERFDQCNHIDRESSPVRSFWFVLGFIAGFASLAFFLHSAA